MVVRILVRFSTIPSVWVVDQTALLERVVMVGAIRIRRATLEHARASEPTGTSQAAEDWIATKGS
jgi:hypothetical protein